MHDAAQQTIHRKICFIHLDIVASMLNHFRAHRRLPMPVMLPAMLEPVMNLRF